MSKLIHSSIMTPDGTILVSKHRHDYVTHMDENGLKYMLDGGIDYQRINVHPEHYHKDMSLYDDQPHEVQRWVLRWGTYGKDGDQPLTHKPIAEMDLTHIEAVLDTQRMSDVYRACMVKELEYRNDG